MELDDLNFGGNIEKGIPDKKDIQRVLNKAFRDMGMNAVAIEKLLTYATEMKILLDPPPVPSWRNKTDRSLNLLSYFISEEDCTWQLFSQIVDRGMYTDLSLISMIKKMIEPRFTAREAPVRNAFLAKITDSRRVPLKDQGPLLSSIMVRWMDQGRHYDIGLLYCACSIAGANLYVERILVAMEKTLTEKELDGAETLAAKFPENVATLEKWRLEKKSRIPE